MNTRNVLWLGALVCLVAGWIDPPPAGASDFLVRLHHVSPDESEPEVPNRTVRAPKGVTIDDGRIELSITRAPVTRPVNWFSRILRAIRLINLGGLAR